MPTGKPTNLSWVQQLDELAPPEGSSFDKASAWEKLQIKLEGNQYPKKAIWVWWAAASVILFIGIFLFLNNNVTPKTTTTTNVKKSNKATPALSTEKESLVLPLEKTLPVTVKMNNQPDHKNGKTIPVIEKKKTNDIKQPELPGPGLVTNIRLVNIMDTGSVKKTNAITDHAGINKKKLAVVHNNELTRQDIIETPPASGSATGIIPDFRKFVFENTIKAENINVPSVKYKKRLLPFGNSNKPKD